MGADVRRALLMRDRQRAIAQTASLYNSPKSDQEIERLQVSKFNEVWRYCLDEVPFYQRWASEHQLPPSITTTAELRNFPVLQKKAIVDNSTEIFQHGKITTAYSSGGTTGTPTRYPLGPGEALGNYARTYAGRAWWGIRPFDSYVHLWGHAHLFAGGLSGRVAKAKRRVADGVIRATRLNAYDMTPESLERHYLDLCRSRPTYLLGYTSAVVKLAHFIERNQLDTSQLVELKAVIVTAETVTEPDVRIVSRIFGVPVVTEYGSAETGTIATSREGTWPLQVFWDSFILTVGLDQAVSVTTLSRRLFPLINYDIGDKAVALPSKVGGIYRLANVQGRMQDVVRVRTLDGKPLDLSAILPVHILKNDGRVIAVQFRQESDFNLRIFVQLSGKASVPEILSFFSQRLKIDYPAFDPSSVAVEIVQEPKLTKAGKHALFVD